MFGPSAKDAVGNTFFIYFFFFFLSSNSSEQTHTTQKPPPPIGRPTDFDLAQNWATQAVGPREDGHGPGGQSQSKGTWTLLILGFSVLVTS